MNLKLRITGIAISALFISLASSAQDTTAVMRDTSSESKYGLPKKKDFDRFSAGISFGVNYFQADIEKNSRNNNSLLHLPYDLMYGAQVSYQFTHAVALRLRAMFGEFTAESTEDIPGLPKGYYFYESPIMEYTLNAVFTIGNISFLERNKRFHLIGALGGGIFTIDGELRDSSNRTVVSRTGNISEGMINVGLGFKYQISRRIDAGLAYDFRKTFTDKLDGINKPTTEKDNYSMINLSVNYNFGSKERLMEWVNPLEVVYNDLGEIKERMDVMSGDIDRDGVSDLFDKDNATPDGVKVYGDGTSTDTDADSIADYRDADPYTTRGAAVDSTGKEVDTDSDGVPDSRDLEPNTEKGDLVNFQGISLNKAMGNNAIGWLPPVFFDLDQSTVKTAQRDRLVIVAKVLVNNPDVKISIVGNADQTGPETYNQKLALRRAETVKDHLIKYYGIDGARITTESKGENDQFAKNLNPMNRRVDFVIVQ